MANNKLLSEALNYLSHGFSIIPVRGKTCILESWKELQTRKPTKEEVEKWFLELNPTGIAIITGRISGLVVLDAEKEADLSKFNIPRTPTVKTGGGGFHYYFKHPEKELPTRIKFMPAVDFKGEGGYVVCPPSQHASGKDYEWLIKFDEAELAGMPDWLAQALNKQPDANVKKDWEPILAGKPEGARHNAAVSLAGKLFCHIPLENWDDVVLPLLDAWNERNDPPLPWLEILQIANSISQKELTSREQRIIKNLSDENNANVNVLTPVSLGELVSKELTEIQWAIEQLIPEAGITMLSAPSGTAKTWLALHFAIQVSQGLPVLDKFETKKQRVLFLEEDSTDRLIIHRLKLLNPDKTAPVDFLIRSGIKLDDEKSMAALNEIVKKENVGLVIFDTFAQFHSQDENSNKDMVKIFAPLKKMTSAGITFLILHHHRKSGKDDETNVYKDYSVDARGASAITGMLNSHLMIYRLSKNKFILRQTKLWEAEEMDPLEFGIVKEFDNTVIKFLGTKESEKDRKSLVEETIMENLKESNFTREELAEKVNDIASRSIVASIVARLKKEKKIIVVGKTGPKERTELYGLPAESEVNEIETQNKTEKEATENTTTAESTAENDQK